MTKDRNRAAELLSLGELPESSLGMSGSVILLTQHDLDLPPGATAEVRSVSVYHPSSLESALNAAAPSQAEREGDALEARPGFASSSSSLNFAFDWARRRSSPSRGRATSPRGCGPSVALSLVRPGYFERLAESSRRATRKDGTLRYSESAPWSERADRAGPVETSLYVIARLRLPQREGARQEAR